LGDVSRVNELIELNKIFYPNLSMKNSFIEIGQEILLPPMNIKTDGRIELSSGNLVDIQIDKNMYVISSRQRWTSDGGFTSAEYQHFYLTDTKVYFEKDLALGDCIDIIHGYGGGGSNVYAIYKQE